jgi:hypothetical protein
MKYAITDERGHIYEIQDTEPTEEQLGGYLVSHEISDEDAATVEASSERMWYIDDVLYDFDGYIYRSKRDYTNQKIDEKFSDDIDGAKKLLRDHFSEKRYDVEVGGLDMGGLSVRTDRLTVARIYQAQSLATADPTFTTEWKLGDGSFITIDATLIGQLSAVITAHIQSSFVQEKTVNASIDAATTIDELKAIEW